MQTCLECLWKLLYKPITQIFVMPKEPYCKGSFSTKEIANMIVNFFSPLRTEIKPFLSIRMPEHLNVFSHLLSHTEGTPLETLQKAARQSKEKANQCGICAVCENCAYRFYQSILDGNITERPLPVSLKDYFNHSPQLYYYQQRSKNAQDRKNLEDHLICLKGFASSTPAITTATFDSNCVGGGLYINYQGKGIVIDPGIGFVKNMHEAGIFIEDIDIVIVTHNHIDHNMDMSIISSLKYDLVRYNEQKRNMISNLFDLPHKSAHEITWILDESSKKKFANETKGAGQCYVLSEFIGSVKNVKGIRIAAARTHHMKSSAGRFLPHTYGIKLLLDYPNGECSLGYTSDTGYFPDLDRFFHHTDLLIFNISDIYVRDVKGLRDKRTHLGYNGSLKLLRGSMPRLAIASEFACTNGDNRVAVAKSLKDESTMPVDCALLPAEIGLEVVLPTQTVRCAVCKNHVNAKHIHAIAPIKDFEKIQYVCSNCL